MTLFWDGILFETKSLHFCDWGQVVQIITALCENGMTEQAKPLIGKIPMRAGYFMVRC